MTDGLGQSIDWADEYVTAAKENERLNKWIADLQTGMYVNCVYCGHRYGPVANTPVSQADMLKRHIETCPNHPMSKLRDQTNKLVEAVNDVIHMLPHRVSDSLLLVIYATRQLSGTKKEEVNIENDLKFVRSIIPGSPYLIEQDFTHPWSIRCRSPHGMTDEQWETFKGKCRGYFGDRLTEFFHFVNHMHRDFIIYVKQGQ